MTKEEQERLNKDLIGSVGTSILKKQVKEDLENGANPNWFNKEGFSAMMQSVIVGDVEIFETLIKYGGDVDAQNPDGFSTVDFAKLYGDKQMLDLAVQHSKGKPSHPQKSHLLDPVYLGKER